MAGRRRILTSALPQPKLSAAVLSLLQPDQRFDAWALAWAQSAPTVDISHSVRLSHALPEATKHSVVGVLEELRALSQLRTEEATKRIAAIEAVLAQRPPDEMGHPLVLALRDADFAVRRMAIKVLGSLRLPAAMEPLFSLIVSPVDRGSVYEMADAIDHLGTAVPGDMIDRAIAALDRPEDHVVYMAADFLRYQWKVDRAYRALLGGVHRQPIAHAAARAICQRGEPNESLVQHLRELLRAGDGGVPQAAAIALAGLGDEAGKRWLERESRALEKM